MGHADKSEGRKRADDSVAGGLLRRWVAVWAFAEHVPTLGTPGD